MNIINIQEALKETAAYIILNQFRIGNTLLVCYTELFFHSAESQQIMPGVKKGCIFNKRVNYYLAGNRNTLNKAHAIAIIIIFNLNFS